MNFISPFWTKVLCCITLTSAGILILPGCDPAGTASNDPVCQASSSADTNHEVLTKKQTVCNAPSDKWALLGLNDEDIGDVTVLATHPDNPTTIYAGSPNIGVVGKLLKSTDCGISWDTLHTGGNYEDIQFSSADPAVLYVSSSAIIKSADGGETWSNLSSNLELAPERHVVSMAVNPENEDVLYAGTGGSFGGPLYKTTDGGLNWRRLAPENTSLDGVTSLAVDSSDPDVIYAGTTGGLLKSTDAGTSWRSLKSTGLFVDVAVSPHVRGRIYAGASGEGLYVSEDGGDNWSKEALSDSVKAPSGLVVHPQRENDLWVSSEEGIYHKNQETARWEAINEGLPHYDVASVEVGSQGDMLYAGLSKSSREGGGVYVRNVGSEDTGIAPPPDICP